MSVPSTRTQSDYIAMPYPNNTTLCCPPCQVPRQNLNLTIYNGPPDPNDFYSGQTRCFMSVGLLDTKSGPGTVLGQSNGWDAGVAWTLVGCSDTRFGTLVIPSPCSTQVTTTSPSFPGVTIPAGTNCCVPVFYNYAYRPVSQNVILNYNPVLNMWWSDWQYSLGKTEYGKGSICPPNAGVTQTTWDHGYFTFTRWTANCAGNQPFSVQSQGFRYIEGSPLSLRGESITFSAKSTDNGQSLFNAWVGSPTFYTQQEDPITTVTFNQLPGVILQCYPFLYQIKVASGYFTLTAAS